MRLVAVVTLSLCSGFLAAGVSAWSAHRLHKPSAVEEIPGFLVAGDWDDAIESARERGVAVVLYARLAGSSPRPSAPEVPLTDPMLELLRDATVSQALARFVPVQVTLNGGPTDRALAAQLGIHAAPLFLIFEPGENKPVLVDALEPVCGTSFDRRGLAWELLRTSLGSAQLRDLESRYEGEDAPGEALALAWSLRLAAAGRWEDASKVRARSQDGSPAAQGPLTRFRRLRDAFLEPESPTPADQETALEAQLLREDDSMLLFMGWTSVASRLEESASAAKSAGGEHLGVPSIRWERRLRETTRKAWISCPDQLVLPFGAIVVERFARSPDDLDSLDRAFMGAVVRTMGKALRKATEPEQAYGEAWLGEAKEALPQR